MNLKKIILFYCIFLKSVLLYTQEKIYIDEKMNQIDSLIYTKKCFQYPYKCINYKTDSLNLFKITYKFEFGKLDKVQYSQLRKLLIRDSNKNIDKNEIIILKYYYRLISFEAALESHEKRIKLLKPYYNKKKSYSFNDTIADVNINISIARFNRKIYDKEIMGVVKKNEKCVKKLESKYKVRIINMHDGLDSFPKKYKNSNWIGIPTSIRNIFFNIKNNHDILIIKPDGEYLLIGSLFSENSFEEIISNNNWENYKQQWKETINKYKLRGLGIFSYNSIRKKKHCLNDY